MQRVLRRFSDPDLSRTVLAEVRRKAGCIGRTLTFMEVCGTHTAAFSASGLRDALEGQIRLRSGPGCPVCVTPQAEVDRMVALARQNDHIICTFGDMMEVPGSQSCLRSERARGAEVRVIYSPWEALELARDNRKRTVILLAVGFETTAPAVSAVLRRAAEEGQANLRILSIQRMLLPALRCLLYDSEVKLDGIILPGHVAAVVGKKSFDFVASGAGLPAVIAGFEVLDMLRALNALLSMLCRDEVALSNQYRRAVSDNGNRAARADTERIFSRCDAEWRGLGNVPNSGLQLRDEFAVHDAAPLASPGTAADGGDDGCRCGDILRAAAEPEDCPLVGVACDPVHPLGPCMVSREGSCFNYYHYSREESTGD